MFLVRTFPSIPLPPQLKNSSSAIRGQLQPEMPDARWVHQKYLRPTLPLFGKTKQETLEKIWVSVLSVKCCN